MGVLKCFTKDFKLNPVGNLESFECVKKQNQDIPVMFQADRSIYTMEDILDLGRDWRTRLFDGYCHYPKNVDEDLN